MRGSCWIAVVAAFSALTPAADAAFPGANGKIAFDADEGCFHGCATATARRFSGRGCSCLRWARTPGLQVAHRIDGLPVDPDLEVHVRPEAVAGAAGRADHLALANVLADAHANR